MCINQILYTSCQSLRGDGFDGYGRYSTVLDNDVSFLRETLRQPGNAVGRFFTVLQVPTTLQLILHFEGSLIDLPRAMRGCPERTIRV